MRPRIAEKSQDRLGRPCRDAPNNNMTKATPRLAPALVCPEWIVLPAFFNRHRPDVLRLQSSAVARLGQQVKNEAQHLLPSPPNGIRENIGGGQVFTMITQKQ